MSDILITGSSGFIGSHLKRALPDAVGLDRVSANTTEIVQDVCTVNIGFGVDTIFHLAAITDYDEYMSNPDKTIRENLFGAVNLLKQFPDARFIFASTTGVPTNNWSNPYISSKVYAEQAIKLLSNNYVILRFQNIYGLGGHGVIPKWLNSGKIIIYGNGEQLRDFTYIDDLISHLTDLKCGECETHCIGTGKLTTINELYNIYSRITGKKDMVYHKSRECDPPLPGDTADIICHTALEDGIKHMVSKKQP